jgi:hypothetical protein
MYYMAQELVEHSKKRSLVFVGIVVAVAAIIIALV